MFKGRGGHQMSRGSGTKDGYKTDKSRANLSGGRAWSSQGPGPSSQGSGLMFRRASCVHTVGKQTPEAEPTASHLQGEHATTKAPTRNLSLNALCSAQATATSLFLSIHKQQAGRAVTAQLSTQFSQRVHTYSHGPPSGPVN